MTLQTASFPVTYEWMAMLLSELGNTGKTQAENYKRCERRDTYLYVTSVFIFQGLRSCIIS